MVIKFNRICTPFKQERMIHMYLPDDYKTSNKKYPVLYFFDGHNLYYNEDATYGKSWGLKDFLDNWDQELIVVGIECSHEGNNRLSEYSPYDIHGSSWGWGEITGQGEKTMDWIVNELKPYIDTNYPSLSDRANTGIAGSSMGGLMAVYAGFHSNNVFSKLGCISSAIGMVWDDLCDELMETPLDPDTKFYIDWGSNEASSQDGLARSTDHNLTLAHILTKKGVQTYPRIVVGGTHCEASWEKQLPIWMNYLWNE